MLRHSPKITSIFQSNTTFMQIGTTKTTILIWYADESGSDWVKPFTWVIVSDDLHPNIFDHSGHLHWEIIFWGVVFGVDNIFVIFKIKIFGEVWLIITFEALIPLLTSPPPWVFIETQKSAKLSITELTRMLNTRIQTFLMRLVILKKTISWERLVTWVVTSSSGAVSYCHDISHQPAMSPSQSF